MQSENDSVDDLLLPTLRAARALIDKPSKWTQGIGARDSAGVATTINDPDAQCYCVEGAFMKAAAADPLMHWHTRGQLRAEMDNAFCSAAEQLKLPRAGESPTAFPSNYNDHPLATHKNMLRALDKAIKGIASHE